MQRFANRAVLPLLASIGVLCGSLGLTPARPVPPHSSAVHIPPHQLATLHHAVINPHLHLHPTNNQPGTKVVHGHHQTTTIVVVHHHTTDWHYNEWARVHRATGTIVGRVTDASGRLVEGAGVWLRHPSGAPFRHTAMKHVVHTGPSGGFVMRGVRLGAYRVRAHLGKPAAAVGTVVHGGQTSSVELRL